MEMASLSDVNEGHSDSADDDTDEYGPSATENLVCQMTVQIAIEFEEIDVGHYKVVFHDKKDIGNCSWVEFTYANKSKAGHGPDKSIFAVTTVQFDLCQKEGFDFSLSSLTPDTSVVLAEVTVRCQKLIWSFRTLSPLRAQRKVTIAGMMSEAKLDKSAALAFRYLRFNERLLDFGGHEPGWIDPRHKDAGGDESNFHDLRISTLTNCDVLKFHALGLSVALCFCQQLSPKRYICIEQLTGRFFDVRAAWKNSVEPIPVKYIANRLYNSECDTLKPLTDDQQLNACLLYVGIGEDRSSMDTKLRQWMLRKAGTEAAPVYLTASVPRALRAVQTPATLFQPNGKKFHARSARVLGTGKQQMKLQTDYATSGRAYVMHESMACALDKVLGLEFTLGGINTLLRRLSVQQKAGLFSLPFFSVRAETPVKKHAEPNIVVDIDNILFCATIKGGLFRLEDTASVAVFVKLLQTKFPGLTSRSRVSLSKTQLISLVKPASLAIGSNARCVKFSLLSANEPLHFLIVVSNTIPGPKRRKLLGKRVWAALTQTLQLLKPVMQLSECLKVRCMENDSLPNWTLDLNFGIIIPILFSMAYGEQNKVDVSIQVTTFNGKAAPNARIAVPANGFCRETLDPTVHNFLKSISCGETVMSLCSSLPTIRINGIALLLNPSVTWSIGCTANLPGSIITFASKPSLNEHEIHSLPTLLFKLKNEGKEFYPMGMSPNEVNCIERRGGVEIDPKFMQGGSQWNYFSTPMRVQTYSPLCRAGQSLLEGEGLGVLRLQEVFQNHTSSLANGSFLCDYSRIGSITKNALDTAKAVFKELDNQVPGRIEIGHISSTALNVNNAKHGRALTRALDRERVVPIIESNTSSDTEEDDEVDDCVDASETAYSFVNEGSDVLLIQFDRVEFMDCPALVDQANRCLLVTIEIAKSRMKIFDCAPTNEFRSHVFEALSCLLLSCIDRLSFDDNVVARVSLEVTCCEVIGILRNMLSGRGLYWNRAEDERVMLDPFPILSFFGNRPLYGFLENGPLMALGLTKLGLLSVWEEIETPRLSRAVLPVRKRAPDFEVARAKAETMKLLRVAVKDEKSLFLCGCGRRFSAYTELRLHQTSLEGMNCTKLDFRGDFQSTLTQTERVQFQRLDDGQKDLIKSALRGFNLFITGPGGCGKTACVDLVIKIMHRLFNFNDGVEILRLAIQGLQAFNFKGQTVAGLFGRLITGNDLNGFVGGLMGNTELVDRIRRIKVIFVDEVSLMNQFTFSVLVELIRQVKGVHSRSGGVQLLFLGDVMQLPPVQTNSASSDGVPCFQSQLFYDVFDRVHFLRGSHRFKEEELSDMMKLIRTANTPDIGSEFTSGHLEVLLSFGSGMEEFEVGALHLYHTNLGRRSCNSRMLASAIGEVVEIASITRYGDGTLGDGAILLADAHWLQQDIPQVFVVKAGSPVVMLRNNKDLKVFNGSLGTFLRWDPVHKLAEIDWGGTVGLKPLHMESFIVDGLKDCTRRALPISLGYAMTIHKSQGIEHDKVVVHLDYDESRPTAKPANGALYTALSRCKTKFGVKLVIAEQHNRVNVCNWFQPPSDGAKFLKEFAIPLTDFHLDIAEFVARKQTSHPSTEVFNPVAGLVWHVNRAQVFIGSENSIWSPLDCIQSYPDQTRKNADQPGTSYSTVRDCETDLETCGESKPAERESEPQDEDADEVVVKRRRIGSRNKVVIDDSCTD